jgi:hypothetical protein
VRTKEKQSALSTGRTVYGVLYIEYSHQQMLKLNLVVVVGLFAIELLMFLFVMPLDDEN